MSGGTGRCQGRTDRRIRQIVLPSANGRYKAVRTLQTVSLEGFSNLMGPMRADVS